MIPQTFRKLPQTFPPTFLSAMGYTGSGRFIALYWDPTSDQSVWWDGTLGQTGANWWAYIQLTDHLFPPGHPDRYATGSSDNHPSHWIILDTRSGAIYLALVHQAKPFLANQWAVDSQEVTA